MEISIIALPLLAAIISGGFGKFIGDRNSEIVRGIDREVPKSSNPWFNIKVCAKSLAVSSFAFLSK